MRLRSAGHNLDSELIALAGDDVKLLGVSVEELPEGAELLAEAAG
eukprot:CAMPEP_0197906624 /NCGR_PEP_ID=MMETSP1439-20131203/63116_1 /TAXON_ID=66791 /ORGANISM="Gonyaulax spinifera, Strain CCMP409" /LENGTH=44 /DNA_ID= /DNA_START= /DNA_END= /DNA_ORIENTATION=